MYPFFGCLEEHLELEGDYFSKKICDELPRMIDYRIVLFAASELRPEMAAGM